LNRKILILGATSGIGRELAVIYAEKGDTVYATGRRSELLEELKAFFPGLIKTRCFDITSEDCPSYIEEIINDSGGIDLCIISSGVGYPNPELDYKLELDTFSVNITGFTIASCLMFNHFKKRGGGHLAGISSIAGLRADDRNPAYGTSKNFERFYLSALRKKSLKNKLNITVTAILPGFVDTAMAKSDKIFWLQPVRKASEQIYKALENKKRNVYITRRWTLVAWLIKIIPDYIFNKI